MTFQGHFEAAIGGDPTAAPNSLTFTDLSARTTDKMLSITRARRSGATGAPEPTSATVNLSAETAAGHDSLVYGKATSTYYPNIHKGLLVRHYLNTGARYLGLTGAAGSRASTPDAASLDIVSDLYTAIEFRCPILIPAAGAVNYQITGKHNATGNQRSWIVEIDQYGAMYFWWSTTGADFPHAVATVPVPCPDQGPMTAGIYIDVDNGAAGKTVYFWWYKGTIPELNAALTVNERRWRLGDPVTTAGTTSIFNSTAPLEIGDISASAGAPYPGGINALEARAGNWTGTVAANPRFTTQTPGASSFVDTAAVPKTWTMNAPAAITDRKIRLMGQLASNGTDLPGHGVALTAQVQWDIAGVLRRLRQGEEPLQSALFRRIMSPRLSQLTGGAVLDAYWPLEDARDSTSAYSPVAGVPPMTVGGSLEFASDDRWPASKAMAAVPATSPWGLNGKVPKSTVGEWEATWLWNSASPPGTASTLLVITASGTARTWELTYSSTQVALGVSAADGSVFVIDTMAWDTDFEFQSILRLEAVQNGGNVDYVFSWIPLDGPSAGSVVFMNGSFAATCGRLKGVSAFEPSSGPEGHSIAQIAVTSGTGNSWLAGADQAFTGEAAAARAFRLASEQGVLMLVDGFYAQFGSGPAANFAMGEQPMGPQLPKKLTDLLDDCALVSGGMVGEATELLGLTFRSGWTMNNQTPAVTTSGATITPFLPSYDDRDFVNDATVSRTNGSSARYQSPIQTEGHYPDARDINAANDADLGSQASWWVHEATTPESRIRSLTFEIAKDATLVDQFLEVSRGDVVRAQSLPAVLASTTTDQLFDGWTEEISEFLWTVTAATRPALPHEVAVLGDAARGKLDSAGSQLNSTFVAGVDTSMSVLVTLGQGWVTAGGEFPFDVAVSGARVTVTAIGALAAGVQVFTVSATISNGVTKSIPAGTAVSLWRPSVLGL